MSTGRVKSGRPRYEIIVVVVVVVEYYCFLIIIIVVDGRCVPPIFSKQNLRFFKNRSFPSEKPLAGKRCLLLL